MMRNSFQNRHSQKFLHRPRYNLPDCLLEDQCRCNSMFLLPQWHLINAKVEPSRCSSHIQVYDASCMQGFKNPFCWVGDSFASSRLANLLKLPQRMNEWIQSYSILKRTWKTIECTNHPIFVPNLDFITFISSDSQCLGRRSWATGVVLQSQMADCLTRCLGWYWDHIDYTLG